MAAEADDFLLDVDDGPAYESFAEEIEVLKRAWLNEKSSPEPLEYEAHAVQRLKEALETQHQQTTEAAHDSLEDLFNANVYQMEINRLTFLMKCYLRTRLAKIERYAVHIMSTPALRMRLSEEEQLFAARYRMLQEAHFRASCLSSIPEAFQKTDVAAERMVPQPDLETNVFVRCNESVGSVQLADEGEASFTVSLNQGDIYILRYSKISSLLLQNKVSLW
eukprot:m.88345 g.88345  ORF g.88345 m.88345 type:complete len:221 (-) comp8496_c0_seq3:109-771(-)